MASLETRRLLEKIQSSDDPTWGFYVYGTYTLRPQEQRDANGGSDEDGAQIETADSAHFQAVLSKLYGLATDSLQEDSWIEPYNQQFIDALRLQPAARLPGASLTDVCTHFREHYAVILDPKRMHEPDYWDTPEYQTTGPKYDWCLVVDDEALQSIDNGPEPIGPVSPEDAKSRKLSYKAHLVFVKLLCKSYTTMKRPHVLAASIRGSHDDHPDDCRCILWDGWLKFSPVMLLEVWDENNSGDIETYYKGPNQLLSIS